MSAPGAPLDDLPALPRDDDGPVFRAPWEAQAFALAVRLAEQGVFAWPEFSAALAAEVAAAAARGEPDLGETYYRHWLRALESLVARKGVLAQADLARRADEWRQAYLATPHGAPVELTAARGKKI